MSIDVFVNDVDKCVNEEEVNLYRISHILEILKNSLCTITKIQKNGLCGVYITNATILSLYQWCYQNHCYENLLEDPSYLQQIKVIKELISNLKDELTSTESNYKKLINNLKKLQSNS